MVGRFAQPGDLLLLLLALSQLMAHRLLVVDAVGLEAQEEDSIVKTGSRPGGLTLVLGLSGIGGRRPTSVPILSMSGPENKDWGHPRTQGRMSIQ